MTDRDPVMDAQMIAERLTPPMYPGAMSQTSEDLRSDRIRVVPSIEVLLTELARLRSVLAQVRAANETMRRERQEIEDMLGRPIKDGELGWAVKVWGGLER